MVVDPQQVQQVVQAAPQIINWSINVADLIAVIAAAFLLYGRMVKIETQIAPIVKWWNQMVEAEHQLGRRWSDGEPPPVVGTGLGKIR